LTRSSRRPSPASRAVRRSRRPAPRRATFLERYRNLLLWIGGIAVFAGLVFVGFVAPGLSPAYACVNPFEPTPAPSFVAPSRAPVASGATPAPAVTPPPPGYVEPDMGRNHVAVGTKVTYTWCPPASGWHYPPPGGPIKGGLYGPNDKTVPQGWIHNMEHGAIVLLYNCTGDGCTDDGQAALRSLLARWPDSPICHFPPGALTPVIARFDDMPYPYAALVWDTVLPMQTLDEKLLFDFYAARAERFNPENQCPQLSSPGPTPTSVPVTPTTVPTTPAGSAAPAPSASSAPAAS